MTEITYDAVVAAPGFSLGIRCDGEDWVEEIEFIEPHREQKAKAPLAAEVARQLHAYLKDPGFVFGLPLKPSGLRLRPAAEAFRNPVPAPRLGTDRRHSLWPDTHLRRTGEAPEQCATRRRPGLRGQPVPDRRPLPSRCCERWRPRRFCA